MVNYEPDQFLANLHKYFVLIVERHNCTRHRSSFAEVLDRKIMRRILRKTPDDGLGRLGDTSTLAHPAVVDGLVRR